MRNPNSWRRINKIINYSDSDNDNDNDTELLAAKAQERYILHTSEINGPTLHSKLGSTS